MIIYDTQTSKLMKDKIDEQVGKCYFASNLAFHKQGMKKIMRFITTGLYMT